MKHEANENEVGWICVFNKDKNIVVDSKNIRHNYSLVSLSHPYNQLFGWLTSISNSPMYSV
jgi:hypothetical protein